LLALEENRASRGAIVEIFRHLHGLKGNTGLLLSEAQVALPGPHPLYYLQKGSHAVESAVDQFRKVEVFRVSDEEIAFLFEALDFLQRQIRAFQEGRLEPVTDLILLGRLGLSAADFDTAEPASESGANVFQNVAPQSAAASRLFLDQLPAGGLAALRNFHRSVDTLVKAARYGAQEAVLALAQRQIAIAEQALSSPSPLADLPLGELRALQQQIEAHLSDHPEHAPLQPVPAEAEPSLPQKESQQGTIRVDQRKIDDLMRLVGQMVVLRNQFSDFAARAEQTEALGLLQGELRQFGEDFSRASDQLQHDVMALRLFPLRNVFQRLQRLVRDLSVSLGKEIRLVTEGEEIQLDKTLLDHLGEPLVHLLRNSADHGIETPTARLGNGKPAAGTISVRASNEGSSVVITISDDGSGLDSSAIRARAVSAGLVSEDEVAEMTNDQVHEFIFHPGFSTAETVTSLSGRGVGLDLVRNTIRTLRGQPHRRECGKRRHNFPSSPSCERVGFPRHPSGGQQGGIHHPGGINPRPGACRYARAAAVSQHSAGGDCRASAAGPPSFGIAWRPAVHTSWLSLCLWQ
jgi:chemotaxis protein histidine kinase CheA